MHLNRHKSPKRNSRRFALGWFLLILGWSLLMGWGLASVTAAQPSTQKATTEIGTVDPVTPPYQLGEQIYRESCGSCHLALPPAVMPNETWQQLLQDPQHHYSVQLQPLGSPQIYLVWRYLRDYSRPLNKEESVPFQLSDSRYFKALHPKVKLPHPVGVNSCVACHPSAAQYNFRRLTPEWENSS